MVTLLPMPFRNAAATVFPGGEAGGMGLVRLSFPGVSDPLLSACMSDVTGPG